MISYGKKRPWKSVTPKTKAMQSRVDDTIASEKEEMLLVAQWWCKEKLLFHKLLSAKNRLQKATVGPSCLVSHYSLN